MDDGHFFATTDHENACHGELGCEHASHTAASKVKPYRKMAGGEDASFALEKTPLKDGTEIITLV